MVGLACANPNDSPGADLNVVSFLDFCYMKYKTNISINKPMHWISMKQTKPMHWTFFIADGVTSFFLFKFCHITQTNKPMHLISMKQN